MNSALPVIHWLPAHTSIDRTTQSILSRAHSTLSAERTSTLPQSSTTPKPAIDIPFTVPSVVSAAQANIDKEIETIQQLSDIASKHPYYKFNYAWTRTVQDTVRIQFLAPSSAKAFTELQLRSAIRFCYADGWVASLRARRANCLQWMMLGGS